MKPNIPAVISSSSKIARKIAYWKLKRAPLILHSCLLYRGIKKTRKRHGSFTEINESGGMEHIRVVQ
jgi:hypothetical protein